MQTITDNISCNSATDKDSAKFQVCKTMRPVEIAYTYINAFSRCFYPKETYKTLINSYHPVSF